MTPPNKASRGEQGCNNAPWMEDCPECVRDAIQRGMSLEKYWREVRPNLRCAHGVKGPFPFKGPDGLDLTARDGVKACGSAEFMALVGLLEAAVFATGGDPSHPEVVKARDAVRAAYGVLVLQNGQERQHEGSTTQAPAVGVLAAGGGAGMPRDAAPGGHDAAAEGAKAVARLKWLHSPGSSSVDGWEWGVFRVRWLNDGRGNVAEVQQTLSDFSDLDAARGVEGGHRG